MITKKRFFLAAVAMFLLAAVVLLFFSFTPLYNRIMPSRCLTLHGSLPSGTAIQAIVFYRTDSFFCRESRRDSGAFSAEGIPLESVSTTADKNDRYELTFPVERESLWCDWNWREAHIYMNRFQPGSADKGYVGPSDEIIILDHDDNPTESAMVIECVGTPGDMPGTTEFTLCRNKTTPSPDWWDRGSAEAPIPDGATEVALDIVFTRGPRFTPQEYPEDANKTQEYFRLYDLWRANATKAGSE